jgi:hypothetical protein
MRYLGRDALALSQLNSLPVPWARLAGSHDAGALQLAGVPARTTLDREQRVHAALDIARAVQGGDVAALAPDAASEVLLARAGGIDCTAAASRRAWLAAVTGLHERTAAFLDAAAGTQLWQGLRGSACAKLADADERRWLDFMQAMATGSSGEVAVQGLAWLQATDAALSARQLTEVLLGTAAALIGERRPEEARQLLLRYLPAMDNPGRYELAIRLLSGLSAMKP